MKDGTFACQGYHNTGGWESLTTKNGFLTALEDASPRLRYPWDGFPRGHSLL